MHARHSARLHQPGRRHWWPAALALLATLCLGGSGALAQQGEPPAAPSPRDGRQFQDWTLRCGVPTKGQPEVCEMFQQRVNDGKQTVMLTVVGRLPGSAELGMLIILPLGVSLPPGVGIKIDDGAEQRAVFQRCDPEGCRIERLLDDDLIARLEGGRTATVTFETYDRSGRRQVVPVPLSLLGFTAALAEVKK